MVGAGLAYGPRLCVVLEQLGQSLKRFARWVLPRQVGAQGIQAGVATDCWQRMVSGQGKG